MSEKKDVRILAYESSCDETSTAVIKNGRDIESLIVATQIKSHQRFGGVVPEVASRHHMEVISQITKEALSEANCSWKDIDAIAVTYGPGLVGALLIGVSAAKAASMATGIPLIGVDHIMGHIMAAQLKDEIEYPALALQVSGGHTEIVLLKDPVHFEIIGDTLDDAAGESYEVAKFKIKAPTDSSILVKGFTLSTTAGMVDIRNALLQLAIDSSKIASNYREIQNSNGANLETLMPLMADVKTKLPPYVDANGDTVSITPEANEGKAKVDTATSAMNGFIQNVNRTYHKIMENWTIGTGRDKAVEAFNAFMSKSKMYQQTLSDVSQSISTAVKNYSF